MLLLCLLLTAGTVFGASTTPPPGEPIQARDTRGGFYRQNGALSWPEPEWRSRVPAAAPAVNPPRALRYTNEFQPNVELARDYRFEPYYRQDLSAYDRNRDRDLYDSPRYMDFNRQPASPPRRIIYYDDLSNKGRGGPYYQPQPATNYDTYRGFNPSAIRSPSIGVAPYRYPDQGRNYNPNYNSILSEGTVENAPLIDDPYRSYNPRQPAPWSVQVGTSLTVKDDGRHGTGGASRRYYVQSQREEPALARSMEYNRPGDRLWAALQPRI